MVCVPKDKVYHISSVLSVILQKKKKGGKQFLVMHFVCDSQ